jgi:hypothetical protein
MATGTIRTWIARNDDVSWPGTPSWEDGDTKLAFTWWHRTSVATGAAVVTGIRELDTSAPGGNLLASRLTPFTAVTPGLRSAVITSDGREIVAAACHDTNPPGHPRGSVTAKIIELSAADGRLLRVLRTQTARYTNLGGQDDLDAGCVVLSTDPSGNYVLVQDFQFGRLDNGIFTALPGANPDVTYLAVRW